MRVLLLLFVWYDQMIYKVDAIELISRSLDLVNLTYMFSISNVLAHVIHRVIGFIIQNYDILILRNVEH